MKIARLLLFLLSVITLTACSSSDDEPTRNYRKNYYTVTLSLGGEYVTVTEEPMSKAQTNAKKYVGINIYCKPAGNPNSDYSHYAYGVFDNTDKMSISLPGEYIYKFECTSAKEADDTFPNSVLSQPFTVNNYYSALNLNQFVVSSSQYLCDIKSGRTLVALDSENMELRTYPRMDRFYGELDNYDPSEIQSVTIPLKRTVFGIKITVEGVPDGSLTWKQKGAQSTNQSLIFSHGSASGNSQQEYSHIYTFKSVYDCWNNANHSENFIIQFTWTRSNNFQQTFEKEITVKRNVMSVLNVSLKGTDIAAGIGIDEETSDMVTEEIPVEFDGQGN
ncbi:MAG: hypothetical protein K2M94_07200 [Paramuribaculum sp.]|nr:hypothetical protein [Paramuribaculum sp.]